METKKTETEAKPKTVAAPMPDPPPKPDPEKEAKEAFAVYAAQPGNDGYKDDAMIQRHFVTGYMRGAAPKGK